MADNHTNSRQRLGSSSVEIDDSEVRHRRASSVRHSSPMQSFGEIEFSGLNQTAKFVRMAETAPEEMIRRILHDKWDLRPPTLVISVFGNTFEKKRQLKMIFKKGLWKAAESAGCWVVSGGFNVGIMKLAGEAVRDYTDAYGGNRMIALGVADWGCVSRNHILESATKEGTYPALYQSEEQADEDELAEDNSNAFQDTTTEERPLDPNHTHFFLLDSGSSDHRRGHDIAFRSLFERAISSWPAEITDNAGTEGTRLETRVPICGLLVGGDLYTLRQAYLSISSNRCPIVVTKGSGGTADAIALAMNVAASYFEAKEETDKKGGEEIPLEVKMEEVLRDCFHDLHPDVYDYQEDSVHLKEIVTSYAYLVSVFDMEEDTDLDGYMISALLSSAGGEVQSDKLNLDQLEITLTLNRADIAKEKIFLESKKWKKGDLNNYMYQALMSDRHDFVKLFLEQGFSLEEFLTVYMLEKLYTDQLKKLNSKVAIFHQLWEYHRSHRSGKVALREVGKVIRVLVGDFYHPLYTTKGFQTNVCTHEDHKHGKHDGHELEDVSEDDDHDNAKDGYRTREKRHKNATEPIETYIVPAPQDDSKLKAVQLERPARELLIWSLLVGKLQMAELFWTMEKEPIAGALLASMLLSSMVKRTDDFTDKEDYKNYARRFEEQAEGVLGECYREDERRAQLLINRRLKFYGQSSVILLAAEGQSIRFMAHPCCQDFLTSTWMGQLSPKNNFTRFTFGILFGLILPIVVPRIMLYKLSFAQIEDGYVARDEDKEKGIQSAHDRNLQKASALEMGAMGEEMHPEDDEDIQYYPSQPKPVVKTMSPIEPEISLEQSVRLTCRQLLRRTKDFYMSPVVRFVYNTLSYIVFLVIFSYLLLFDLHMKYNGTEIIVLVWIVTLLSEEVKQASLSGISFSTYISDGWNKLDCMALGMFVMGFIMRTISYVNHGHQTISPTYDNVLILTDELFTSARVCYAFSLFAFYIRLMYIFSFHIALGPKLVMIGKMVMNDLIPFMVILLVFVLGYGVSFHAIAYPNGFYSRTNYTGVEIQGKDAYEILVSFLSMSYYQMFGEFALDDIRGESNDCTQNGQCPHWTGRWLVPIMLGIYVLLTNILMFNLLIAMFSKTYEEIESSSTYYWNYQRYQMIAEYVDRSPLAPPLIIFWQIYELIRFCKFNCNRELASSNINDPFSVTFSKNPSKERELMKWEHMKAMDYLRNLEIAQRGQKIRGDGRSVVFRATGNQPAAQNPLMGMDLKGEMTAVTEAINMQLDKRFRDVDTQMQKLSESDNELYVIIQTLALQQQKVLDRLDNLRTCSCNEVVTEAGTTPKGEPITKLHLAIRDAIESSQVPIQPVFQDQTLSSERPLGKVEDIPDIPMTEEDNIGDPSLDNVIGPPISDDITGRVLERRVAGHRMWRYAPFNFEMYPGMRMNVPQDKQAWHVEYPGYFAYDASDEILLYPSDDAHDGDLVKLRFSFNEYDVLNKVQRVSFLGPYRMEHASGAPLNPMGRSGLKDKGLLLRWGPNHSVVLVMTRCSRSPKGDPLTRSGKNILQYAALERAKRYCIPWYLVDHVPSCDLDICVQETVLAFMRMKLRANFSERKAEYLFRIIEAASIEQVFRGYLDDHLNADNAWIETVVINIQESANYHFNDDLLKILIEENVDEQAKWMEVAHSTNLRSSHNNVLKVVAEELEAYY